MEINSITYNALNSYFKSLENTGFVVEGITNKLLLLTFLANLLSNDVNGWVTEEDYILIDSTLSCIADTCYIQYVGGTKPTTPISHYIEDSPVRVTEDNVIRLTESDIMRIANL